MRKRAVLAAGTIGLLGLMVLMSGCGNKGQDISERPTDTAVQSQDVETEEVSENDEEDSSEGKDKEKESRGAGSGLASPSVNGALHVEGTRLVDENREPVQLRGISTHGIAWFPDYINTSCLTQLHEEWKANVIRLAMYTAESGGYCTDGDKAYLKQLIREGVACAAEQDMYVIIDWHILSDSDPNLYKEEAKAFFAEISLEYAEAKHVLYEICNEPNGGTDWKDIKAYAAEVIPVIRANDEDAVILVGTPNWSQFVDQAAADPITEYENLMYTLHFYAATHKEDLRNTMIQAVENGLPVFVSEYGICDAGGSGAIDEEQADAWIRTMNQYGISYVAWNLSNKEETSAIFQSSCSKTGGFAQEDLSASGQWLYRMLTDAQKGEAAGTVVQQEKPGRGQSNTLSDQVRPSRSGMCYGMSAGDSKETLTKNENGAAGKENGTGAVAGGMDALDGQTWTSGEVEISALLDESWESGGEKFYKYILTLQNLSENEVEEWTVDVPFEEEPVLHDGWNGEYAVQGTVLHITSKDYNAVIPAKAAVTDVGFIVSGSK